MKTLNDYKEEYNKLKVKKNLKGEEALEAVKQYGFALPYVNEDMFSEDTEIITLNGKRYKLIK